MHNATINKKLVRLGQAGPSSGMKRCDLGTLNKGVKGSDTHATLWPCKKDHPHHRISEKNGRLYCLECEQEKARVRRECAA